MKKYLAKFENEAAYDEFKAGEDFVTPNVSWCVGEDSVKWNPYVIPSETRLVAKYDVFSTGYATQLQSALTSNIASMEIDGVELQTPVSAYTFDTKGEHVVKYTLIDNTSIGASAFQSCASLTSITIPDSVTSIGQNAFRECHFPSLTIGSGVTTIGYSAFSTCTTLSSLTIPDSVTTIERNAFASCVSLSSVTIGSGVISIGKTVFEHCEDLSSITYNGTQAQWASVTKGTNWNRNVPATVVHCSDGDATL